ncbi:MAG TPA: peptidase [Caulobacteraceae bacterium]|jgi:putative proteasome-type protease|nr:peptidase [Caulobacteraceae bacterium]
MTYCVGMLLEEGLVMLADTRTNAGVDQVSTFRKLHIFEKPGERVLAIATAGNLSVTQTALSLLKEGLPNALTGEVETLDQAPSMFRAAQMVGHAVRQVRREVSASLVAEDINSDVTLLVGGQIRGGEMALYLVYSAGNFIECGPETPYLQIGETKYGKPMLDRAITYRHELYDALKIGLISFDSTMRSNLAVGLPIDLMVLRRDALTAETRHRIDNDDSYFHDLGQRWSSALRAAHMAIPTPPYRTRDG